MRMIGLTGGIGSGKSTVADLLGRAGAVVIDADQVARDVVGVGEPALELIRERFGEAVIRADGTLDRAAVAAIVFNDKGALADLEAITHPRIGARIREVIADTAAAEEADGQERTLVLDHPLLIESGMVQEMAEVIAVEVGEDERVRRLVEQRGMPEADARARIAIQASDDERRVVATHVIDNGGDRHELEARVAGLVDELGLSGRGR